MTNKEFKEAQLKLGLENKEIARVLRVSVRTVESWRQGTRGVPGPVTVLLDLFMKKEGDAGRW